jgi:cytochrome b pre-mRNA-processing protein 3
MLGVLGKSAGRKKLVGRLYAATVERARAPVFFTKLGVPDTIDGRFDLLALHAWLVFEKLRTEQLGELSQGLMDTIFIGFDEGLRDLGTGDMGMGRRIRKLADAFYGRLQAYGASDDVSAMTEAVLRNLYRGQGDLAHAEIVAHYVEGARAHVARSDVTSGEVDFGPLP